ncbi:MAG: DUF4185 domain-containing protein [Microthrixaceae bacterium]
MDQALGRVLRPALLILVTLLGSSALAGCLAPDAPDPTGTAPFGRLEAVFADGDGIRVQGWAIDPDTSAPVVVTMSSQQRTRTFVANLERPDLAGYGRGTAHGFDARYPGLAPGPRQICVWVTNVGAGTQDRLLGCTTVELRPMDPFGNVEAMGSPAPGRVRVIGWASDPDAGGPVEILATVDGAPADRREADVSRPELGAFLGVPPQLGFDLDLPATPGRHLVCVRAFNRAVGVDRLLGCQDVVAQAPPEDRRPTGSVTAVVPVAGGVRVSGTATDVDGAVGSVRVAVLGGATSSVTVVGGSFSTTVALPVGPARVCVTVPDVASPPGPFLAGDRALPCSTAVVSVGAVPSVGTSGAPVWTAPVGPSPASPVTGVDRDAGVSVSLRDGSVLWLFGDSTKIEADGSYRYFINNTAAWATRDALTVTRDGAVGNSPVQFATPGPGFPTCPEDAPRQAMWPMSGVVVAEGSRDRVNVLMGNVCLGDALRIVPMGVAVVTWLYDPATPPLDLPITATVVNQALFAPGEPQWGTAAVVANDGLAYAYACAFPPDGGLPTQYGPCRVARVAPDRVADRTAWRFWAGGSTWSANQGAAVELVMPPGPDGTSPPMPGFSVRAEPTQGVYVMAYSPWPGFTDRVQVRVATAPTGPWTAPVEVNLPGCADTVTGTGFYCYAGTAQPQLSEPGLLGLGYYDQRVRVDSSGGQYLTVKVPFSVVVIP